MGLHASNYAVSVWLNNGALHLWSVRKTERDPEAMAYESFVAFEKLDLDAGKIRSAIVACGLLEGKKLIVSTSNGDVYIVPQGAYSYLLTSWNPQRDALHKYRATS